MRYDSDLLYRPPGEWRSYLLQCTIGCSHNKCTFCAMYKEKKFRVRPVEEILEDIDMARSYYGPNVERVFLMDGDAIVMRTEQLLQILEKLYAAFPKLQKVTTYAGPRSTLSKTPEELRALREAGLTRAYLGVESGSDAVLQAIQKGCTAAEMLQAGQNLVAAGIDLWAIVILGLTGQGGDWEEHVLSTAGIINKMKPRHLSAMTFAPAAGTPLGEDVLAGRFQVCTPDQILEECHLLLEHLDVDPLHFTSNHASNYLPLTGGPGEVPLPDRPGAGRQDPPAQDPESGDLRCPESEDRPAGAFGSGGAVFIGSAAAASQPQVRPDKDGAPEQDQPPDEQSAVAEKDLRQDQDDLVHRRVEEPVVLPREEQGVEYHKSPLKVQGGQQAHHGEDDAQPRGSPEAGAPAQKGAGHQAHPPAQQEPEEQEGGRQGQHGQIQQEEDPHIGKMVPAGL